MNTRTLLVLLLAAATGCVDNNASVRLSAACFPPTPNDDGSCSYPAKCDSVMMGNLWVDTTYTLTGGTLYWPFQADNLRPNNGTRDGGTNTATAFITGYKISYTSSSVSLPDVTLDDTTRTVEAQGSTVLSIPVIPASVATLLAGNIDPLFTAELRAEIRATGHYADGQTIETGPFSVVVNVVNGFGAGGSCPDPASPVLIGVCPQPGQSGVSLCKAP
jgi:hypothetical protein